MSKVVGNLYRGSQPKDAGDIYILKESRITMVINLEEGWRVWEDEENTCNKMGIKYVHYGLSNIFAPTAAETRAILGDIASELSHGGRVFVHCRRGKDRTGWIISQWLVHFQGWFAKGAWLNAKKNGMSWIYRYFLWRYSAFERVANEKLF